MRNQPAQIGDVGYRTMEIRAAGDAATPGFDGHLSHFRSVDGYGTAFVPGTFRKTLKEKGIRIPILWQHERGEPIGKPTELREDKVGLYVKADVLEEVRRGAECMALLRADVPLGLSFGFRIVKARPPEDSDQLDYSSAPEWFKSKEGRADVRVVTEAAVFEGSVVTFPGNTNVDIANVRSAAELDTLSSILNAIRAGTLGDAQSETVQQIVEAFRDREPEPSSDDTSLAELEALRRRNNGRAALALANLSQFL